MRYAAQIELYGAMPRAVSVGLFSADAAPLRSLLATSPRDCLASLRQLIPRLADEAAETTLEEVRAAEERIRADVDTIGGFVSYTLFLRALPDALAALELRWEAAERSMA